MAISRCMGHEPKGRTRNYTMQVRPVGYPNTSLVCGSKDCCEHGMIWPEDFEADCEAEDRATLNFPAPDWWK